MSTFAVAVLVCDGFEEVELTVPKTALEKEGINVDIISPNHTVRAWNHTNWSKDYLVDILLEDANPNGYGALLLPGGVINPDKLRAIDSAVSFIKHFLEGNKPIAAICHGPWSLIETGQLKGRSLTSYHSIKTDLINAGANWQDKEVVVDKNLITSRSPKDLPVFVTKILADFRS